MDHFCAHRDCKNQGPLIAIHEFLSAHPPATIDGVCYFCEDHIGVFASLYTMYKDLEANYAGTVKNSYQIGNALVYRLVFQSMLREETSSAATGHTHWMRKLAHWASIPQEVWDGYAENERKEEEARKSLFIPVDWDAVLEQIEGCEKFMEKNPEEDSEEDSEEVW